LGGLHRLRHVVVALLMLTVWRGPSAGRRARVASFLDRRDGLVEVIDREYRVMRPDYTVCQQHIKYLTRN
jgi:hypothetical protein